MSGYLPRHSVLVITGMSGSGKSTAARTLEDAGWLCIDNLPAPLLPKVAELGVGHDQLAFVVDVREGIYLESAPQALKELSAAGHAVKIIFFDASDEALVRRYSETRRRHPLGGNDGVAEGIAQERKALSELRALADQLIDTSSLTTHELKKLIHARFVTSKDTGLSITFMSFGFKYGVPTNVDVVLDVRFIDNPYFREELRALTGRDPPVADFVLQDAAAQGFLDRTTELLAYLLPLYHKEGKAYLTVAIGCTGGKHRSVVIIRALAERLKPSGAASDFQLWDRDIEKP